MSDALAVMQSAPLVMQSEAKHLVPLEPAPFAELTLSPFASLWVNSANVFKVTLS